MSWFHRSLKRAKLDGSRAGKQRQNTLERSPYHRRLVCEALEARTLLSVALAQAAAGAGVQTGSAAQHQTLADLPAAAQQAISSTLGHEQSVYHAASGAAGVAMANPANAFNAKVSSGALQVSTGSDTWSMSLVGLGYGGAVQPLGTAQTSTNGNRVDVNYSTVDEWYVNGPGGLEQGFTVPPPAQSEAMGSLTVTLALGGDLTGTVNAAGDGLTLTRPNGSAALGYTGLTAHDATGKMLPAWLEVQTIGGRQELLIHVNAAGAQGPITIDPFVEVAKLIASDGVSGDGLGASVSISGNTVVVGAPYATVGSNIEQGAAYVFTGSGTSWSQVAKLTASDDAAYDRFGNSVSISGSTVVAGAWEVKVGTNYMQGAAYVFTEPSGGWANTSSPTATLIASGGAMYDEFGYSVSIGDNGDTVVVGARQPTVGSTASSGPGAAYVFTEPNNGWAGTLYQTAKLVPSDGIANDNFGTSVSISGNTVVVGAPLKNSNLGAAYVFTEPSNGWTGILPQTAELTASNGGYFGDSVSISGPTVVVGATFAHAGEGAADVFTEPSNGWAGTLSQTAELTPSDGADNDYFGYSVSISGNTVVVGAAKATVGGNSDQGAAYVFTEPGSAWESMAQAAALSDGAADAVFGQSVVISGNTLVVGALEVTAGGGSGPGAAYVFQTPSVPTTVTAVSTTAAANSTYTVGETVPITVTFSGLVTVSGTPQLTLNDGAVVNYSSGSGTATLTFNYVVGAGQSTPDLDYASNGALALNGGSIVDAAGNPAVLGLPATGSDGLATQNIDIDTTPTATAVSSTTPAGAYSTGTVIPITVSFSEAVTVTGTPQLTLNDGAVVNYTSGSGTSTLTFNYTVAAGQTTLDLDYTSTAALALNGGSIQDATGTAAVLTLPAIDTDGLATKNIVIEDSLPATANIAIFNAYVLGANNQPVTVVNVGQWVYIEADFTTRNLPSTATYRIAITVNGLTADFGYFTNGAGTTGVDYWYSDWGGFIAAPGSNQVTVTIDPDHSVAETGYTDNTMSFTFNAVSPAAGGLSYTAAQIRAAYGINSIPDFGSATADGSGQTIAIVDVGNDPSILTDLDGFDRAMSLTTDSGQTLYQQYGAASSILTVYNQAGVNITPYIGASGTNGVPPDGGWTGEITLDVEWAHAIAPGAKIDLIETNVGTGTTWGNLFAGDATAANLPGVSVVSNSWAWSEWSGETAYDSSTFVTPSGHTGVTFLAGTGDWGEPADYPALSPNVVAVGGTQLTLDNNAYASETGWSGSGGGQSQFESEPSYQLSVQSTGFRTVPDVSFDAGSGVTSFYNGSLSYGGYGTSLACPCWAGLIAIANQGLVAEGSTTLNSPANPQQTLQALYSLPAGDFHDITSGYNGLSAGPGYDEVTGRGTPIANLLIPDLVSSVPLSLSKSSVSVIPSSIQSGNTATVTLTAKEATGSQETSGGLNVVFSVGAGSIGSGTFGPITDHGNGTYSATFTGTIAGNLSIVTTIDGQAVTSTAPTLTVLAPTVTGVSSTKPTGAYPAGTAIPITVTFNEPVTVTGAPQLALNAGDGATAEYTSGSGGSTLTFVYIVGAGQNSTDLDYPSINALGLNGGTIEDAAGNAAVLTLPATGSDGLANRKIVIDTTVPTVNGVSTTQATGAYPAGTVIPITVAFSEPVTVTGTPQLALDAGGSASASYRSGNGGSTLTFTYTVAAGQNSTDLDYSSINALTGSIEDAAGNAAVLTLPAPASGNDGLGSRNIVIDTTPPSVSITQEPAALTNSTSAMFVFTGADNLTPTANLVFLVSLDGSAFAPAASPVNYPNLSAGQHTFQVVSEDQAGNISPPAYYKWTIDTTPPSVSITEEPKALTNNTSATFAFTGADNLTPTASLVFLVSLDGGTFAPATSPVNYSDLASSGHTFKVESEDQAGNFSTPVSYAWTIDTTLPTVTGVSSAKPSGAYAAGTAIPISIAFSEAVTVTGAPQLALNAGSSVAAVYSGGSGGSTLTFTYTVAAGQNTSELDYVGINALTLGSGSIADLAGNAAVLTLPATGSDGLASEKIAIETTPPTVTGVAAASRPLSGGAPVTITGTNLLDATAVKFGATTIPMSSFLSDTATQIVVDSPLSKSAGTVNVTVTTVGGVSHTSSADKFTYVAAPTVKRIKPASGALAGGATVTITGTNLLDATAVDFGGAAVTNIISDTATKIVVKSPLATAAGPVYVTVTTAGGVSKTSSADKFTYLAAAAAAVVSKGSIIPAANAATLTLPPTGTDLAIAQLYGNNDEKKLLWFNEK